MFEMWRHAEVQKYSGIAEDADGIEINMPAKTSDDSDRLIEFWLYCHGASLRNERNRCVF